MKSPHLLNLGNSRKVKENLCGILDAPALDKIEAEIAANAVGLYNLGREQYNFAMKLTSKGWRQKVSRLYYAAYNAGRAVRLFSTGEYSTDVKDHQNFGRLPDDFPDKDGYVSDLLLLREDRNKCDYDHLARPTDLALGLGKSAALVTNFLRDAREYLLGRGLSPKEMV